MAQTYHIAAGVQSPNPIVQQVSPHSLAHVGRFREVALKRDEDVKIYDNFTADQICIGQALALGCGPKVRFQAGVRGYDSNPDFMFNTVEELEKIVTTKAPMAEGSRISYTVSYHHQHATRVFVMRKNGVTFVWYYNPWGSRMDQEFAQMLHDTNLRSTPGDPDQEQTLNILKDSDELSCKEDVLGEWEKSHVEYFPVLETELFHIPETHVMSYLEWKRSQSGRSDIHIIHPSISMPIVGPQNQYGRAGCDAHNFFVHAACGILSTACPTADRWIVGACCVWEELYSAHVHADIAHGDHPLDIIVNLRNRDMLTQELSARDLIGKFMFVLMPREAGYGCGSALTNLENLMGSLPPREHILHFPEYSVGVVASYQQAVQTLDLMKVDGHLNGYDSANQKVIQKLVNDFIKAVTKEHTTEEHKRKVDARKRSQPRFQIAMLEHILIYFLKFLLFVAACKQA